MLDFRNLVLIAVLFSLFSVATPASDLSGLDYELSGDYVMGREHVTTFDYTVNVEYKPVDTALVIDESGSMGGVMEDAKDGAKSYVDNTRTGDGDENAVVEFDDYASTIQPLTSSKQDAKDAIDSISDGGGTDLPEGVEEGHDALSSGSNDQQVMIVLADGGGGDPGYEADQARDDGITVHGIMYGSGASTSEFESLTGADNCETSSSENGDGDKCWYAETGTIEDVYSSIREETDSERSADLHVVMPEHARSFSRDPDNIRGDDQREYVINDIPAENSGTYSIEFPWRPTDQGSNLLMKTGNSYIEFTEDGSTTNYYFDQTQSNQVDYVDFNVFDSSVTRENGDIDVSVSVRNEGNTESRETDFSIYDESGNSIDETLPPLSPGEETTYAYTLDRSHAVYDDAEMIRAKADVTGVWGDDGRELEPDEDNNVRKLGYPVDPTDISPENIEYGETLVEEISLGHPDPDSIFGYYDLTIGDNGYEPEVLEHDNRSYASTGLTTTTQDQEVDRAEAYYNFTNRIYDSYGSRSFFNHSIFVDNPLPQLVHHTPGDDGYVSNYPVELEAVVEDENDDVVKVYLFNHTDGHLLHKEEVDTQGSVSTEWEVPESPADYQLRIKVEDRWDNYTSIVDFRKIVGGEYRSPVKTDREYTSIITSTNEIRDFYITLDNKIGVEKNMNISLSGVNAEFGNGKKYKEITLEGYSSEELLIRLMPEKTGERTLNITSENTDIGLNKTKEVPVYITEPGSASAPSNVSGIGSLQMLFLALMTSTLYYLRL